MQTINDYLVVKKEVIEEQRSSGGIITNVSSVFDFKDKFSKKNTVKAEVVFDNESIPFLKKGERVVLNPDKGADTTMEWDELTVIKSDQFIAKIDKDGKYIVHPDCVIVKINKIDRDSLFSKWITRDDGEKVQLFIQPEPDKDSVQRSKIYVSYAEVIQIGTNVIGINEGDVSILDYTTDNDIDNVLYFDDEKNKYLVVAGTTILHKEDEWAYATRENQRDVKVSRIGDIQTFSPIVGLLRKDKLIARFPYVFINHESNVVEKVSQFGILYTEEQYILEREVLAVSDESKKRYGIKENQIVLVDDYDIFSIQLKDGKIDCVMDYDILMGKL